MSSPIEISIIIPTYREAANIPEVARVVSAVMAGTALTYEIIFIDDDSQDGSEAVFVSLEKELPVRHVIRKQARGLSTAVLLGIHEARGEYVVVMDADLSHPAAVIPQMVALLKSGAHDFIIGSRYVPGGSLDQHWSFTRRLISRVATLLAQPLTRIHDPMSGFFAFEHSRMPENRILSPIGYKIGLELLVKGQFHQPAEVPIHFSDRQHGESKLSWQEHIAYLRHLRRLYQHRYPFFSEFFQFCLVGGIGFIIDLVIYLGLQAVFGVSHVVARALSFWAAASSNWALNRILTFSQRKKTAKLIQWQSFVLTSLFGFGINWGTYFVLTSYVPFFHEHLILALMTGVIMGLGFNFTFARLFVFIPFEEEIATADQLGWRTLRKQNKSADESQRRE